MSEQDTQQFENSSVSVRYKKKPGCLIKMDVLVSKEALLATYAKALKEVRKEITLPGFRKGKVPDDVVKKRFSETIDNHFRALLTELAFQEGTDLIKRKPFTRKSLKKVEVVSLDMNKGAEVYFEYEASPDVPQIDPAKLEITNIPFTPPTEEDLSNQLLKLKLLHAEKTPLEEGQALQTGDFALATLTSHKENEQPLFQKKELYLDAQFCQDWLLQALLGMKKGEAKEITLPEESEECTLSIDDAFHCTLPEEDDSFAQKAHAQNKQDLIEKVQSRLTFEAKFKAFEQVRHDLRNELIRLWAFDLPQSLIEGETDARFFAYWNTLVKQQKENSIDKEKVKKEFSDEVKRYFTLLFLLRPLAQSVKIGGVQQSEILEELTHQMMHAPFETRYIYPGLPEEEAHHRLIMALLMRKCEDWCIEQRLQLTMPERS